MRPCISLWRLSIHLHFGLFIYLSVLSSIHLSIHSAYPKQNKFQKVSLTDWKDSCTFGKVTMAKKKSRRFTLFFSFIIQLSVNKKEKNIILSNCSTALMQGRYTWRHNSVLLSIIKPVQPFMKEGMTLYSDIPGYQAPHGGTLYCPTPHPCYCLKTRHCCH